MAATPIQAPQSRCDAVDPVLLSKLVCPRDKSALSECGGHLTCTAGHSFPIADGVPVLLLSEVKQTHVEGERSLVFADPNSQIKAPSFDIVEGKVDPFVSKSIGQTNGSLYQHLTGKLDAYPIPHLDLPPGNSKPFLEIGCNWGRWCIAAARLGYETFGMDPSLKSILAARRVTTQLGLHIHYVVADGRWVPFASNAFDQIFSYSVLQHLSKDNVRLILAEARRVLTSDGRYLIQMPNAFGLRCLYHQVRRGFREAEGFEVRYWTPKELKSVFANLLGSAKLSVDGYLSLNAQVSDLQFLPARYRALVRTSQVLRKFSEIIPGLTYLADSVYLSSP